MIRLAFLGVGSLRCGVPVLFSLATFFGERPLEVILWDPDPERLDLFDRLARVAFASMRTPHRLMATEDLEEALADATHVIATVEEYALRRLRRKTPDPEAWIESRIVLRPTLDLPTQNWPPLPSEDDEVALPHQILRWVKGDDYVSHVLESYPRTLVHTWLEQHVSPQR